MDQQPQPQLTKQERREQQREQQRSDHQRQARASRTKSVVIGIVILVAFGGGLLAWLSRSGGGTGGNSTSIFDSRRICINERIPLAMHIHPRVRIVIDGKEETIPKDVGVIGLCIRPIHTHDGSGEIHVESNVARDFRLGEFFSVWGKTFTKDQILDSKADDKHRITVTVNGKESAEYDTLVLRDKDEIVITYETALLR